jgi:aminopeptidase N
MKNLTVHLHLSFTSKLTKTLQGFYEGSYFDETEKTNKKFLNTQFSPVDARRAFPCFDNPGTFHMNSLNNKFT